MGQLTDVLVVIWKYNRSISGTCDLYHIALMPQQNFSPIVVVQVIFLYTISHPIFSTYTNFHIGKTTHSYLLHFPEISRMCLHDKIAIICFRHHPTTARRVFIFYIIRWISLYCMYTYIFRVYPSLHIFLYCRSFSLYSLQWTDYFLLVATLSKFTPPTNQMLALFVTIIPWVSLFRNLILLHQPYYLIECAFALNFFNYICVSIHLKHCSLFCSKSLIKIPLLVSPKITVFNICIIFSYYMEHPGFFVKIYCNIQ